jgi:hypothetical protein
MLRSLHISRVTRHDWYLRSFVRSFSIVFLDADATSVMTGGLQRSTVRKQCAFAMLGTQTRWPSGSSGSRGIEIVHGQCYSEESLSAGLKKGKNRGRELAPLAVMTVEAAQMSLRVLVRQQVPRRLAASSLYFLRLAPVVLLARC